VTATEEDVSGRLRYFPSRDTESLRAAVRSWAEGNTGGAAAVAQRLGDTPWDPQLWRSIAGGLGVGGVLLPEALGGLGAGYEDYAASLEELGRGLLATPVLGSLAFGLGALLPLLAEGPPNGPTSDLAVRIAEGQTVAALAVADMAGTWTGSRPAAAAAGDGYVLDGECGVVIDAPRADVLLVFAERSGVLGLFEADAGAAQLHARPCLDPSQEVADVVFGHTPARLIADGPTAERAFTHALRLGRLAVAAEAVGGAEAALDDAVAYALARRQFGRPIASFQAVKHMCADALLAVQEARAVLSYATWALDDEAPEAERALLAAKIAATDAYVAAAERAVQIFGAMGTTREVSVQVHFRRARFLALLLGSNDTDRETLAGLLGFGR
jgi:alkylation response protein AidB-like acyl-CoA dehydrogenase